MAAEPILKDSVSAEAALKELCACVGEQDAAILGGTAVLPSDMPAAFRDLLVHNTHMTPKLSGFHGGSVSLRVLAEHRVDDIYHRKIVLTAPRNGAVVELGIVRLNLDYTSDEVRQAILERATPLGDIVSRFGVLTRVHPQWFLRFETSGHLRTCFDGSGGDVLYGRIGTIFVHEKPAVELLEIVTQHCQA